MVDTAEPSWAAETVGLTESVVGTVAEKAAEKLPGDHKH